MNADAPKKRGWAAIAPEARREISAKGGRAAHQAGTAHEWTSKEAQAAGRKGAAARLRNLRERQAIEANAAAEESQ